MRATSSIRSLHFRRLSESESDSSGVLSRRTSTTNVPRMVDKIGISSADRPKFDALADDVIALPFGPRPANFNSRPGQNSSNGSTAPHLQTPHVFPCRVESPSTPTNFDTGGTGTDQPSIPLLPSFLAQLACAPPHDTVLLYIWMHPPSSRERFTDIPMAGL